MQFNTDLDLPVSYAKLHSAQKDKNPWQKLLEGLREILDGLEPYPYY